MMEMCLCMCCLVGVYLWMASACCGLKRVPVRGCRRKWPGTATWRFFMAMQSPETSRPMPPRPMKSPTMNRPSQRAITPPAVMNRMPRQSSKPCGSGISGAAAFEESAQLQLRLHFSSSQRERGTLIHSIHYWNCMWTVCGQKHECRMTISVGIKATCKPSLCARAAKTSIRFLPERTSPRGTVEQMCGLMAQSCLLFPSSTSMMSVWRPPSPQSPGKVRKKQSVCISCAPAAPLSFWDPFSFSPHKTSISGFWSDYGTKTLKEMGGCRLWAGNSLVFMWPQERQQRSEEVFLMRKTSQWRRAGRAHTGNIHSLPQFKLTFSTGENYSLT